MSSGILERVYEAESLANLLKAGLIKPNTPLKVVFRDEVDNEKIQLIKDLNVTHITCKSKRGDVDFKDISSLRVLRLQGSYNSLSFPLGLEELYAYEADVNNATKELEEMKELKVLEISYGQMYYARRLPPNLTRLFADPVYMKFDLPRIPKTVTDLTFPGYSKHQSESYHLPYRLTRLCMGDLSYKVPDTFSISQFPLLTDLEIPQLPPREWTYLNTLPLTRLVIYPDDSPDQLLPFLPESLTSLKLHTKSGDLDFSSTNLPHLSTLDVKCELLILPRSITDLSVGSPFTKHTVVIMPPELRLEALRFSTARCSPQRVTAANVENLKLLDFRWNSPEWEQILERLPKLTDLKLTRGGGDLDARYPNVTSLYISRLTGPVVFPQKLSRLGVGNISAADVPLGLSSLKVTYIEVPEDYVFTAERWRNIVADKSTFETLLKESTPEQRQQLEKLVQEAW